MVCVNVCLLFCSTPPSFRTTSQQQKQHTMLFSKFSSHFSYSLFLVYRLWLDWWSTWKFLLNDTELFSRITLVKIELLSGKKKVSWRILAGWLSYSADIEETQVQASALGCHLLSQHVEEILISFLVGIISKLLKPWFSFFFFFLESVFLFSKQLSPW